MGYEPPEYDEELEPNLWPHFPQVITCDTCSKAKVENDGETCPDCVEYQAWRKRQLANARARQAQAMRDAASPGVCARCEGRGLQNGRPVKCPACARPAPLIASSYQDQADMPQPYRVRTSCGHVVARQMRPSLVGVPYSPELVIEAPRGRPCGPCGAEIELEFARLDAAALELVQ